MSESNKKNPLNLKRKKPVAPQTPEEAAQAMANFYETMGNCLINLVAIHSDISKSLRDISADTGEIADINLRKARAEGWITPTEFEERTTEEDGEELPDG